MDVVQVANCHSLSPVRLADVSPFLEHYAANHVPHGRAYGAGCQVNACRVYGITH